MKQKEILNNLKRIDLMDFKVQAVEDNETQILDLVREQMREGEDGGGGPIRPEYESELYSDFKTTLHTYMADYGTPDLYLTGDFHKSMVLGIIGEEVIIDATDEKTTDLIQRYGENILELNNESIEKQKPQTTKNFVKLFRNATKL